MKLSFAQKLWLPLILSLLCLAILSAVDAWHTREVALQERKQDLVHATELALSVVKTFADQATAGAMTVDDAKNRAMEALRHMRYGNGDSGYFIILNSRTVMLMHPTQTQLEGKYAGDLTDRNGLRFAQATVDATKRDGRGFVTFTFNKPGTNAVVLKIGYCEAYEPWDWIFATGLYVDDIEAEFHAMLVRSFGMFIFFAAALSAVVTMLNRGILRVIGGEPAYAAEIATRVAGNDLTVIVETAPGDESSLLASIKRMQEQLKGTVRAIQISAESIATATSQIAAGNQDLSRRTEEQATSLEETAASMEELTSTVEHNADNARQAIQVVSQATQVAERGSGVVSQVIDTMLDINASADKVTDIVGVIESIAFQTNILALNAAVEAARAGEQGRAFAVVAAEVRSLAQRSSSASKEIKGLIEQSVRRVRAGAEFVNVAGSTMNEIVQSVGRVTDIMDEIAAASIEQSKGIGQVNEAIGQMDSVTQQNAALVEQAAAAATSLESRAGELRSAVAVFRLA